MQGNAKPFALLVIDTAMSFLPAAQNNPRRLRWALEELRVVAVIIDGQVPGTVEERPVDQLGDLLAVGIDDLQ